MKKITPFFSSFIVTLIVIGIVSFLYIRQSEKKSSLSWEPLSALPSSTTRISVEIPPIIQMSPSTTQIPVKTTKVFTTPTSVNNSQSDKKDIPLTKIYKNEQYGFQFNYPNGWGVKETTPPKDSKILFQLILKEIPLLTIPEHCYDIFYDNLDKVTGNHFRGTLNVYKTADWSFTEQTDADSCLFDYDPQTCDLYATSCENSFDDGEVLCDRYKANMEDKNVIESEDGHKIVRLFAGLEDPITSEINYSLCDPAKNIVIEINVDSPRCFFPSREALNRGALNDWDKPSLDSRVVQFLDELKQVLPTLLVF